MVASDRRRSWPRSVGITLLVLVAAASAGGTWLWSAHTRFDRQMRRVERAGYTERDVVVDGTRVHLLQGPANGKPKLLLIHGQSVDAKNYAPVLPALADHFEVYAVDCFGHGQSSHDPDLYSAKTHGEKLAAFVEQEVQGPVYVSGHSSGGLIATWIAGNRPDLVSGVLLEDPPLFTTQLPRAETTWNYVDLATNAHSYLQTGETDWPAYSWSHQHMWKFFGNGAQPIIDAGLKYHARHPDKPIKVWYLPQFNEILRPSGTYDPRFGDAFYTGSWDEDFDLAASLSGIQAPTTLVHTKVAYDDDGTLMAAMDSADAERGCSLVQDCQLVTVSTGHGFHSEDPKRFVELMVGLAEG